MQAQLSEYERQDRLYRFAHIALTSESQSHPVPKRAGLADPALNIAEVEAAHQGGVFLTKDEQGVSLVLPHFLHMALDPAPVGRPAQIICWPAGLPGDEEITACLPQGRPCFVIAGQGRPQIDPFSVDSDMFTGLGRYPQQGHGFCFAPDRG